MCYPTFFEKLEKSNLLQFFLDNERLKALYRSLVPSFNKLVSDNSGNLADAEDLLQESIVLCYKKIKDPDFVLTSKLETFIYGIGRRKWMYELRKKGKFYEVPEVEDEGNLIDDMIINSEKRNLYLKHFNSLSDSCRNILKLFFDGMKMNEIAHQLNFKSEGYARKRKHNCQAKLIEFIKRDELYVELTNG